MISLKLDTQSVLALFPEGSQARLDLQAAIIANVVNSVIGKKVSAEISKAIDDEVYRQIGKIDIPAEVKLQFFDYAQMRWGHSHVADANPTGCRILAAKVKERVQEECRQTIGNICEEIQIDLSKNLKDRESEFISRVTQNLQSVVRKEIVGQVNKSFPSIIDEAIKARLFPEEKA